MHIQHLVIVNDKGVGAGFLTGQKPSKRDQEIIKRVKEL